MEKKWHYAVIIAVLVTNTGCLRILEKKNFDNTSNTYLIAKELTDSYIKEKRPIKKVAVVGFSDMASGGGSNQNIITGTLPLTDNILEDLGFKITPVKEVIANSFYKTIGTNQSPISLFGFGWDFAEGMRVQVGVSGGFSPGNTDFINLSLEDASKLIDALNVDGLICVTTQFNGNQVGDQVAMTLHGKDMQQAEKAKALWVGILKKHGYSGEMSGVEAFSKAFQLLATRMKLDLDN